MLVGGLISPTAGDAQLLPGTPPLPIIPVPSPPEKVLPPPPPLPQPPPAPPLPPAPVTVETSPAPQVKVEPAPTVKAASKLPAPSPLPPPVKVTPVLPTLRPTPKTAPPTTSAPSSPSGSARAPGAPSRPSSVSRPSLVFSATLRAGRTGGYGGPGSGYADHGSSGLPRRSGQAGGAASPRGAASAVTAPSAATRKLIPGLSPAAAKKHEPGVGLFGMRVPAAARDLIPVALLVLLGMLIAVLAFADNVGVGPRHADWRHVWIRRLRASRSRFTSEVFGAGAARVRASWRRLRSRRWRSRRQPLSR
jgi:outer membrane biosynthesis protein TonB